MSLLDMAVYNRTLAFSEREQLRRYFLDKIPAQAEAHVRFNGHEYLHSENHPNFPFSP